MRTSIYIFALLLCASLCKAEDTNHDTPENAALRAVAGLPTNWVDWTNLVWSLNVMPELGEQFNWNRNEDVVSDFDKQVCASLRLPPGQATLISYKELSLVFHFPKTNEFVPYQEKEMGGRLDLIYQRGAISRTNIPERYPDDYVVPGNYIRLYDPKAKKLWVKIDLLLNVAPLGKPHDGKDVRRSFVYVYQNKWIQRAGDQSLFRRIW